MADYIRKANQSIPLNQDQMMEMARVMKRPTGIRRFVNYVDIVTADGPRKFNTVIKPFQYDMIDLFQNSERSILLASRQMSKCVTGDTLITVRNDKTGEVREITIEAFHKLQQKGL